MEIYIGTINDTVALGFAGANLQTLFLITQQAKLLAQKLYREADRIDTEAAAERIAASNARTEWIRQACRERHHNYGR